MAEARQTADEPAVRELQSNFHDIKLKVNPIEMMLLTLFGIVSVIVLVAGTIVAAIWQFDFWEDKSRAGIASLLTFVLCAGATMLLISFAFFRINSLVVDNLRRGNIAASTWLQRMNFIWGAYSSVKIAQLAARRGVCDLTIRTWRRRQPDAIVPMTVNIEPKPLDESETVFQELREGVIAEAGGVADSGGMMKRNIALMGGWTAVTAVGVTLLFAIFGGFLASRGSLTTFLQFVAAIVLVFLVRIARFGTAQPTRLIVPGGLICRSVMKRLRRSGMQLYKRSESILWVAQMTPHIWSVVVARGDQSERFRATAAEADMLLRAWLSPINPPPLEKLKDLE